MDITGVDNLFSDNETLSKNRSNNISQCGQTVDVVEHLYEIALLEREPDAGNLISHLTGTGKLGKRMKAEK
jgi:hypothetical protein